MGSELLTDSDENEKNEGISDEDIPNFISKMLDDCFPFYLSIGMTSEEYWEGDPSLVKAYRKAYEIKRDRKNQEMWMQGRYIYDAMARMAPLYNVWKPKEPTPYPNEPYPLTEKEVEERMLREERKRQEDIKAKFEAFALGMNKKRAEEKDKENG